MFVRLKSDPVKYTCMYTCLFIFIIFRLVVIQVLSDTQATQALHQVRLEEKEGE